MFKTVSYTGKGQMDRLIVGAMIVNLPVLQSVAAVWPDKKSEHREGLFMSAVANLVGSWCIRYYRKHNAAPGREYILMMFGRWLEQNKDENKTTEMFLRTVLDEMPKEINVQFVIEEAEAKFTHTKANRIKEKLVAMLENPKRFDTEEFRKMTNDEFPNCLVSLSDSGLKDPSDPAAIAKALTARSEALVKYPGAAGDFFGNDLRRNGFVAFMGPEKRGKTNILLDVAWRASSQRKKTLFLSVGDLTEDDMNRRLNARVTGRPVYRTREGRVTSIPKDIIFEDGVPLVEMEPKLYERDLSTQEADAAWARHKEVKKWGTELFLRTEFHYSSTCKASHIRKRISVLTDKEKWKPDVVVIDYADILAPENGAAETRDQINATWKTLNAIRQEFDCLVVTATQTNAGSYEAEKLGMKHFSEDKRKLAHVTAMIGLNQTDDEREQQLIRLNWIVRREDEASPSDELYMAGCPAISSPCIRCAKKPVKTRKAATVGQD